MSTENAPPASDLPATEPLHDELPPVEPPSARFLLQLFVVPALIVVAIVAVWLLFGMLATSEQDWRSLVVELKHPNEQRRWRAAHGLAQLLNADRDLGPKSQHLAANPEIAQNLAELFSTELKTDSKLDKDLEFQAFLARTLGLFDVPDAVLPPLETASLIDHERESDKVRMQKLEVRKNALASIAVLAGRKEAAGEPLESAELSKALIEASLSDDKLVRQVAAFTLGILRDEKSRNRCAVMLTDADALVRANAAIGLARYADKRALPILKEILTLKPLGLADPTYFEQQVAIKNSLLAVDKFVPSLDATEKAELRPLVEAVAKDSPEPVNRNEARSLLEKLL